MFVLAISESERLVNIVELELSWNFVRPSLCAITQSFSRSIPRQLISSARDLQEFVFLTVKILEMGARRGAHLQSFRDDIGSDRASLERELVGLGAF